MFGMTGLHFFVALGVLYKVLYREDSPQGPTPYYKVRLFDKF